MHAHQCATFGTGPFTIFVFHEFHHADLLNGLEVFQNIHPVIFPVTVVQMGKGRAGEISAFTAEFVPKDPQFFAIFNLAVDAMSAFMDVITAATRARFIIPLIGTAKTAVDPASGDPCDRGKGIVGCVHVNSAFPKTVLLEEIIFHQYISAFLK